MEAGGRGGSKGGRGGSRRPTGVCSGHGPEQFRRRARHGLRARPAGPEVGRPSELTINIEKAPRKPRPKPQPSRGSHPLECVNRSSRLPVGGGRRPCGWQAVRSLATAGPPSPRTLGPFGVPVTEATDPAFPEPKLRAAPDPKVRSNSDPPRPSLRMTPGPGREFPPFRDAEGLPPAAMPAN